MKKRLSLLMVLMMVLSLVPMSAFATAGTVPGGRVEADDNDIKVEQVSVKLTQAAYNDLKSGITKLTLSGADFAKKFKDPKVVGATEVDYTSNHKISFNANGAKGVVGVTTADVRSIVLDPKFDNIATINVPAVTMGSEDMDMVLTLWVLFDEADAGDVTLAVEEVDTTGLKVADPIKVAVVKEGQSSDLKMVVADAAKKIGFDGGKLSRVELKDFDGTTPLTSKLELELPDAFNWDLTNTKISVMGSTFTSALKGDNILVLTFDTPATVKTATVEPIVTVDKRDASKGDINLKVTSRGASNQKIESVDGTIGVLADYDVAMTAVEKNKKEAPALYGGEEATIKVKLSGVVGSFTANRDIDFTIKGADVTTDSIKGTKGLDKDAKNFGKEDDGTAEDGEFTLTANDSKEKTLEFEMKIKTDYSQSGPVVLTAESRDFGTIECEVAKVTPAYTVEIAKVTPIKKGESIATADIVIKEAKAGMFDTDEYIVVNLRDQNISGLYFATDYKIEVTNGMKIDDKLTKESSAKKSDEQSIVIDVKSTSSKEAGTITISNLVVMAYGSAVDGEKMLDTYVTEATSFSNAIAKTVNNEKKDPDYTIAYANVVKEYGVTATTTVFVIGSKTYTVNGTQMTANEAPFVAGKGYTMLPVRALAESLGLKADWNSNTKTATFTNDSKVASVVIGADTMYVNGTPLKLNAKSVIKNGSTFIELRSLASAFGVELQWDAATKTVTIIG